MTLYPEKVEPTDDEIIAAYRKYRSVTKVCANLHLGTDQVNRVIDAAGYHRRKRTPKEGSDRKTVPENYLKAIYAYTEGVQVHELRKPYGISLPQLYFWMGRMGVTRREPMKAPKDWHCWECGNPTSIGDMFCCDSHRRTYNDAAIRKGFVVPIHHRTEDRNAQAPCRPAQSEVCNKPSD